MVAEVAHRVVELEDAAGDGAVGKAALDTLDEDGLPAQGVLAVLQAPGSGAVGDQHQVIVLGPVHQREHARMHMEGVGDQLAVHVLGQRRAYHAGIPVVQGRLGVEGMGHAAGPQADSLQGAVEAGAGVADGQADVALLPEGAGEVHAALHFRRVGDHPDHIPVGQHLRRVRGQNGGGRLGALAGRVDEGAFRVAAEDLRAGEVRPEALLLKLPQLPEHRLQDVPVHGHGGGQEGGHAVGQHTRGHPAYAVHVPVGGVSPQVAVNVHIHQARADIRPRRVDNLLRLPAGDGFLHNPGDPVVKQQRLARNLPVCQKNPAVDNGFHTGIHSFVYPIVGL